MDDHHTIEIMLIFVFLVSGLVAVVSGFIVFVMDIRFPNALSTFFNVDPLADYEETFVYDKNTGGASNGASNGHGNEREAVSLKQSFLSLPPNGPRSQVTVISGGMGAGLDGFSPATKRRLENVYHNETVPSETGSIISIN